MRFSQTKLLGVGRHGLMVRALSPTLGDKWTDQGVRGSNPAAALSRSFLGWTNNRTYLGGINAIDFSIATTPYRTVGSVTYVGQVRKDENDKKRIQKESFAFKKHLDYICEWKIIINKKDASLVGCQLKKKEKKFC